MPSTVGFETTVLTSSVMASWIFFDWFSFGISGMAFALIASSSAFTSGFRAGSIDSAGTVDTDSLDWLLFASTGVDALTLRKPLLPVCLLSSGFVGVSTTVLALSDILEEGVEGWFGAKLESVSFTVGIGVSPASLDFSIVEDDTVVDFKTSEVSPPTSLAATLLTNKAEVTIPIETATQCFLTFRNFFIKLQFPSKKYSMFDLQLYLYQ